MSKPTIFFSHSSRDNTQLCRLKEMFCAKTGGSIDVFLSSDGQSIPLGKNWVYRVQEGLESAALMIVFVTPNSIGSNWVYFEAGYSYAKQIRVIPVGFLGGDLGHIRPPLSLLQGFNITSSDTLNNLIALTNEQFGHKHSLSFTPEEYEQILGSDVTTDTGPLDEILEYIEDVRLSLNKKENGLNAEPEQLLPVINALLDGGAIEYQSSKSFIRLRGVTLSIRQETLPRSLRIDADPVAIHATLPTILAVLAAIRSGGVQGLAFTFELTAGMKVRQEPHKITARLYSSEVQLLPEGGLIFRDLKFTTGYYFTDIGHSTQRGNAYIRMTPVKGAFSLEDAGLLLKLLLSAKVIFQEHDPYPYLE